MTFEIDEEKLKSVENKQGFFARLIESIDNFFVNLGKIIKAILILILILSVLIFIGGAILGILLFGWRQL